MIRRLSSLFALWLFLLVAAQAAQIDNVKQKVAAHDPAFAWNPGAVVDGKGGGSPEGFSPITYAHRLGLHASVREGSPEYGNVGWIDPFTNDCSEPPSPTIEAPARLRLDYQTTQSIAQFALYFPRQGNMDGYLPELATAAAVKTVHVFRSNDGVTWESAVRIEQLEWTHPQIIRIPEPKAARFYLLSFEAMSAGNNALRLYEVEAYTDPNDPIATKPLSPVIEVEKTTPQPSDLPGVEFQQPAYKADVNVTTFGMQLKLSSGAASFDLPIDLKPDNVAPAKQWHAVKHAEGQQFSFAASRTGEPGDFTECSLMPEDLGVRMTVKTPPTQPWAQRSSVMVRIPVAGAKFRFLPMFLGSDKPEKSAWPAWYLPTAMASISTDNGTFALVPSTDRHRMGIDGDSITIRLFPDETGEASVLLMPIDGDWVKAYQVAVHDVWGFETMRQYRPTAQTALGMLKWLMVDKVWSEEWQHLRSFPGGDFFFIFYGAPYSIPALWQRAIISGDAEAERKVKLSAKFLIEAPVRVKEGPMKGGYYAQMAGSKEKHTLTDQAHNHWLTTHATGAAMWALLYHQTMLPERDEAIDAALVESADHLIRLQQPDGGWFFAYYEDGTLGSGRYIDSGTIWNIWSLWRAGKALGREDYLQAAERGKQWWLTNFLDKHYFTGYWEDANTHGVIWPTRDGYPAQMATLAFLDMGDTEHAIEAANFLATWIHTRTPYYRNYWTGYGNMGEQWTWPANIYLVPGSAFAFQQIQQHAPNPAAFQPFTSIAKAVAWWVDDEGSGYFPNEASCFTPIHLTELTKSYWVDWCGAQEGSRAIMWIIAEMNKRSQGLIAIDPETLRGTIEGEAAHPWQPDGSVKVTVPNEAMGNQANQLNWLGYRAGNRFYLAVLNDQAQAQDGVQIELAPELGLDGKAQELNLPDRAKAKKPQSDEAGKTTLDIGPQTLRILSWKIAH